MKARVPAVLLGTLLLAGCALAQAAGSVHLEELTSPEVRERVAAGSTTILVPIGGTEQNGPHLALGKHNARARALAGRIAGLLGNALVAPVMAYVPEGGIDPPTEHMRYPGTISIPPDAFEKVLEAVARSFRHHGFRDIVLLGDHGGYQKNLVSVASRLNRQWSAGPARVHAPPEYYRAAQVTGHAGADDTSLALALTPELVRRERLERGPRIGPADGVTDDPRAATLDEGQRRADRIVSSTVEAIGKAVRR